MTNSIFHFDRNIKHQATVFKVPTIVSDPFKAADDQMTQIKSSEKAGGQAFFQIDLRATLIPSVLIRRSEEFNPSVLAFTRSKCLQCDWCRRNSGIQASGTYFTLLSYSNHILASVSVENGIRLNLLELIDVFCCSWRSEIALTRDNTIGIVKKCRTGSDPKQLGFQLKVNEN